MRKSRLIYSISGLAIAALTFGEAKASTYTKLWDFCSSANHDTCSSVNGAQAKRLVMDSNGNLFGVATKEGHTTAWGIVFEFVKGSGGYTYQELYQFCANGSPCTDGAYPNGPLILDSQGNLYGTTQQGGALGYGTIFRLSSSSHGWTLNTLWDFCQNNSCNKGSNPIAGLTYLAAASGATYDGTSSLYGTSSAGGLYGGGTVFELKTPASSPTLKSYYSFCSTSSCTTGSNPNGLIPDANGNLFGTTQTGGYHDNSDCSGNAGCGVAYELDNTGAFTLLHTFCQSVSSNCTDAYSPIGLLAFDSVGNLFGTGSGGANLSCGATNTGCGAIFKIVPNGASSVESIYYSFCSEGSPCSVTGQSPSGTLLIDSSGRFYGTASSGGQNNRGTIFRMAGPVLTTLYNFCSVANCIDGRTPQTGVIRDSGGNLFGTTTFGGTAGADAYPAGVVYEWSP